MIRIKEVIIKQNEAFPWQHTETFRVFHQYHIGAHFIILFFLKFDIYEWLVDARIKFQYIILWHGPRNGRSQVPVYLNDISDLPWWCWKKKVAEEVIARDRCLVAAHAALKKKKKKKSDEVILLKKLSLYF